MPIEARICGILLRYALILIQKKFERRAEFVRNLG
jgi:hypothetical protein